jgi:hypothetical protein
MRRRSQRMDTVIILYFGTSARSLSYVDCESRGKKYIRSVFAFVLCSCVRLSTHAARDETSTHLYSGAPLDAPFFRACTEPDRVLDGSPEAPRDEIHAPVRRELGCWPSPSSSPWTISARTGKITRRRRRPSVTELTHHPPERSGSSETSTLETPSPPSLASIDRTNARTLNHPHRSSSRRPRVVDRAPSIPKTSARILVRVTDGWLASTSASRSCAPWPSSYRRPKPWRPWRPSIRALSEASFVRVRRARQRGGIDRARATSRARASARASMRSIGGAHGARF